MDSIGQTQFWSRPGRQIRLATGLIQVEGEASYIIGETQTD